MRCVEARSTGGPLDPDLRITLNFHPDRIVGGRPILDRMLDDRLYHSQFVTGTGNGGRTAFPGGDRWWWEHHMFGGAYDDAAPHDRPKYGALNLDRRPVGAAPRFGSAHFRLNAAVSRRATFCFPDSHLAPAAVGVAQRTAAVLAAASGPRSGGDPLDGYVEAQVHGPIRFDVDVEALVLDPCFRDTIVEAAARRFPCPIEWHGGFRVTVGELRRYPSYRGTRFLESAVAVAVDGVLDPRRIGEAARSGRYDTQTAKRVWHYLARFGAPDRTIDPEIERS